MSHPSPETWSTGRLLTAAARLVEHTFDSAIVELGVTHAGINVLDALGDVPRTQRELAGACAVQDQTMSRIVDGLERGGLVLRTRDKADRRRVLVARTERGTQVLDEARRTAVGLGIFEDGTAESDACRRALLKIIDRLGHSHGR